MTKNISDAYQNEQFSQFLTKTAAFQGDAHPVLGSQWTKHISDAYQQGEFSDLLAKLETRYQSGLQNKDWENIRNEEEKFKEELTDSEKEELVETLNNFRKELNSLRMERNQSLRLIAQEYPNDYVSHVIHDLKTINETTYEDDFFNTSKQFAEIHFKAKIFSELIHIATIDENGDWTGLENISFKDIEKYRYVIGLDKFQQMLKLSGDQEKIPHEISEYTTKTSNQHNEKYLESLGKGMRPPTNKAENLVAEIMHNFEETHKSSSRNIIILEV